MIKAIIIADNLQFIKEIVNILINEELNVKIEYIATNKEDALSILKRKNADIVFINLKFKLNTKEILNYIRLNSINIPQVVVSIDKLNDIAKLRNYENIGNIFLKTDTPRIMFKKVKRIVDEINNSTNTSNVKDEVVEKVFNMGYNIKLIGTKYLIESIMFIYESNNIDIMNNLEKNVYKKIADNHNKTIVNIKTNIAKSTRAMYGDDTRLTPKYVISDILTKICKSA